MLPKKSKKFLQRDSGLEIEPWAQKIFDEFLNPEAVHRDLEKAVPTAEDKQKSVSAMSSLAVDKAANTGSDIPPAKLTTQISRTSHAHSYWPGAVSAALLVAGVFGQWPYAFYVLLRVLACFSATYTAVSANRMRRSAWAWIMAAVAVVFNPVFPLRMSRNDWSVLDLIAAGVFLASLLVLRKRDGISSKSS